MADANRIAAALRYQQGMALPTPEPDSMVGRALDAAAQWGRGVQKNVSDLVSPTAWAEALKNPPRGVLSQMNPENKQEMINQGIDSALNFGPGVLGTVRAVGGKLMAAPQAEALRLAQQRAALPVEQGGLGLPAGNTPQQRAAAMGGKDAYHFTDAVFNNFDPSKIGSATDEGWLGHGFYTTTDRSVNAPSSTGLQGWNKKVSMPVTILDEQLNQPAIYKNWKQGKKEAMRDATGYPENLTAKEISDALSLEGKTGVTLDYSPTGYNHQEIMTIDPSRIRSRFAAFDPFRRNAAVAAAMGVAAPDLLAQENK